MPTPWLATIATTRDDAERDRDRHVDQHEREHAPRTAGSIDHRGALSAAPSAQRRRRSGAAPARRSAHQVDQVHAARRRRSAPHEIGITDCTTLIGIARHADQRVARRGSAGSTRRPSRAARRTRSRSTCATMPSARRAPRRRLLDHLRAADVRALDRRERRAVEREPGEQHRGDLVVPDSDWPMRAEDDAERHLDGERRPSATMHDPLEHAP